MKKILCLFLFAISAQANADTLPVGCIAATYDCFVAPGMPEKCSWAFNSMGKVLSVEIQKTGTSPAYDIWEGSLDGTTQNVPFHLAVYQRRDSAKTNYLTVDMTVDGKQLFSTGKAMSEVRYLDKNNKKGFAIRCDSDISPSFGG